MGGGPILVGVRRGEALRARVETSPANKVERAMGQSAPPKSHLSRWILLAFLVLAAVLVLLNRDSEVPLSPSAGAPSKVPSLPADTGRQAPIQSAADDESSEMAVTAPDVRPTQDSNTESQPARDIQDAPQAETWTDETYSSSPRSEAAIARARTMEAIQAGIQTARSDPRLPAAVIEELQNPKPVPAEIEETLRQVNLAPPEILEGLRLAGETPPEIAQAIAEAQERGTSDAMRAYMAGETDERPEY